MDIFDLSKATGLSREQILYYEEKGIIPKRYKTKHGEYYQGDVHLLQKTVILRKMGFNLKQVREILDDSVLLDLESLLSEQLSLLEVEKDKFNGAYNLCTTMLCEIRTFGAGKSEHLDAARWLEFIRREEAAGHTSWTAGRIFRPISIFSRCSSPFS